jgi:hypothetical protein
MGTVNPYLAANALGLTNPIDFVTPVGDPAKVQALIDAISLEQTGQFEHRLFLDEMSPACRDSLYVMLVGLKAAVT